GAVEYVLVTLAARGGAHAGRVGTEIGLGQPEAADGRPGRQLRQPLLPVLLRAVGVDREHHEPRLHARERAQAAVAAFQLLVDQAVVRLPQPCAAVFLWQRRPEEAEFGQPRDYTHREPPLAERLGHQRDVLVLDEASRGVAHHALLGREQLLDRVVIRRFVWHSIAPVSRPRRVRRGRLIAAGAPAPARRASPLPSGTS